MQRLVTLAAVLATFVVALPAHAADRTVRWAGRDWVVTDGAMAGVAEGDPANVTLDGSGGLVLRIVKRGAVTTAAEVFSKVRLGFGTYQWHVDGPVDRLGKPTVLGLFNYGARADIGVDAENEIDIEYSTWNGLCDGCNAGFNVWPSTGNVGVGPTGKSVLIDLDGGTRTTSRFTWTRTSVRGVIMRGFVPLGVTRNVLASWTFRPADPKVRIPQIALPVAMNLWCFRDCPPTNERVVLRSFAFAAR